MMIFDADILNWRVMELMLGPERMLFGEAVLRARQDQRDVRRAEIEARGGRMCIQCDAEITWPRPNQVWCDSRCQRAYGNRPPPARAA